MNQLFPRRVALFIALLLLLMVACSSTESGAPTVSIQGTNTGKEEVQSFALDNCSGKADADRTETRGLSTDVTLSVEIAARIGASAQVISGEIEAAVGAAITNGARQSTSIKLSAPPGTHMIFDLVWSGEEQTGVVQNIRGSEIPIAFRAFAPTDVYISRQVDAGCTATPIVRDVFTATPTPQPTATATLVISEPTPMPIPQSTATPLPIPTIDVNLCPPIGSPSAIFVEPLTSMGDLAISSGTGVFANAVRPWGTQPSAYTYARDAFSESCVQFLGSAGLTNLDDSRHCMVSKYDTNRLWIGSVTSGTSLALRKNNAAQFENIGRIEVIPPDARSYLVEYPIETGDEICLEAPTGMTMGGIAQAGGYHLFIGRDLMVFTDSWCMMIEDNGAQHWCQ